VKLDVVFKMSTLCGVRSRRHYLGIWIIRNLDLGIIIVPLGFLSYQNLAHDSWKNKTNPFVLF
jgi:hypothetical protein